MNFATCHHTHFFPKTKKKPIIENEEQIFYGNQTFCWKEMPINEYNIKNYIIKLMVIQPMLCQLNGKTACGDLILIKVNYQANPQERLRFVNCMKKSHPHKNNCHIHSSNWFSSGATQVDPHWDLSLPWVQDLSGDRGWKTWMKACSSKLKTVLNWWNCKL